MLRESLLRVAQGCCLLVGAALAVLGVQDSTPLGVPVEAALGAFALALLAAAGAEHVADRVGRAAVSLVGSGLFVAVAVGPSVVAVAGSVGLLLVGVVLLADSVTDETSLTL